MRFLLNISLVFLALSFFACKKPADRQCFKNNGAYDEVSRPLKEFQTLNLQEHLRYILIPDSVNFVTLKGSSNLLNWISTKEENDVLTIQNLNKCRFLRAYEEPVLVELHFTKLNFLNGDISHSLACHDTIVTDFLNLELYNGSGKVSINVKSEFLNAISKDNHGDLELRGEVEYAHIQCHFNAKTEASQLQIGEKLEVSTTSNREVICQVAGKNFVVNLSGFGNVLYKGNPNQLILNQIGSGSLIKID
jgi:hypothetical protein